MYFRTAYDLLTAGKRIQHFGTKFEYLWYSKDKNIVMMHFKNGTDEEVPYHTLNQYFDEDSNEWELVS